MTTIVTIKSLPSILPRKIFNLTRLHKDERVVVETFKDGTIQIKPFKENTADRRLRKLLKHPHHMGKVFVKTRQDTYDDID